MCCVSYVVTMPTVTPVAPSHYVTSSLSFLYVVAMESCVSQGCGYHGECDISGALSVCRCHRGWTGSFCQQGE